MAPRVHQKASHGRRSTVRNSESLGQEESMLTTPQPPSNRGHFDACSVLIHCTPYADWTNSRIEANFVGRVASNNDGV